MLTIRRLLAPTLFVLGTSSVMADTQSNLEVTDVNDNLTVGIAHFSDQRTDVLMAIEQGVLTYTLGSYDLSLGDGDTKTGTDITGDGTPNMLVEEFSGGAHCCFTYYLYNLEPAFKQIAKIETNDSGARFEKHDGIDGLVMITGDTTFAYWYTYYAASPKPEVKLVWNGSDYVFSPQLMAAPAPSIDALEKKAAAVAASDNWTQTDMDPDLWREMLDLFYSGHADLAWMFLDNGWPGSRPGQGVFTTNFRCQLATSPYWDAIAAMNNIAPDDVPQDCSGNTGY